METYAVARIVGEQPRSIRARRRSSALTWAPRQPPSFRNADQLPRRFPGVDNIVCSAWRTTMFEKAFRISEPARPNSADLPDTRNALDETASHRVNWLIHASFNLAVTSRKGEPGFGIHTRTAAHEPDAHTAVHFSMP
jgi:hypothetical protein